MIGSLRRQPLRAGRGRRQAALGGEDQQLRPRHARRARGRRLLRRMRRGVSRGARGRRQGRLRGPDWGLHGRLGCGCRRRRRTSARSTTRCSRSTCATHKFKWRYKHPEREFPFYSSAAVAAGKVVVGGRDKMIHALDSKSGKALWTYMTRARVESSPAVAGSRVYVGSGDGRFYVLDLRPVRKCGIRHGRAALGVAGHRRRPRRHRVPGRTLGLLWVVHEFEIQGC